MHNELRKVPENTVITVLLKNGVEKKGKIAPCTIEDGSLTLTDGKLLIVVSIADISCLSYEKK